MSSRQNTDSSGQKCRPTRRRGRFFAVRATDERPNEKNRWTERQRQGRLYRELHGIVSDGEIQRFNYSANACDKALTVAHSEYIISSLRQLWEIERHRAGTGYRN
jgi:hypothetical protein